MVCPDCGFKNEADRLFCGACGEPIKGDARLIRDMEKLNERKAEESKVAAERPKDVPLSSRKAVDDDYVVKRSTPKKDYTTEIVLAALATVAFLVLVGCAWYLLKYYL